MRVGAIGCGRHATTTLWPCFPAAGLRLVAVCARSLERAAEAAARFGVPAVYDDMTRMLDGEALDGVVVCVPPDQYGPIVRRCLERRLALFVEKPAADGPGEAEELAAMAAEAGGAVVVGYMKRFAPSYRRARELLASPQFGSPTLASLSWLMGPVGGRVDLRSWLRENPVHHFDLARHLVGELDELRVHAAAASGGEHVVVVGARASSGAVVSLRLATTGSWWQRNETVEIVGAGHAVAVENVDTCTHRPPERPERVWRPNYTVPAPANDSAVVAGFVGELEHWRDVATTGVASESDLANAAATLRLADDIGRLAHSPNDGWISVP